MPNIYRIAAATARSNYTPLPIAQPPTRRRPPQQPLKPPTDRHARQSALPESIRRPSQPPPSPTDRHTPTAMHPRIPSNSRQSRRKRSSSAPHRPSHPVPPNANPFRRPTLAPVPTSPLPSRKSPKIMQILLQTVPPTLVKLSSNAHTSAPAPAAPLPSRKSPKILQILLQTIRPISRQTLTRAPLRQRSLPSRKSPKIMQIRQSRKHLSSNTHTSAPAPASPLPSRKSPKIMQIQLQTTRTTQITAHPQYPMTSYKRCYYPLSTIHWCPLKTYPPPDRELLCYSLSDV